MNTLSVQFLQYDRTDLCAQFHYMLMLPCSVLGFVFDTVLVFTRSTKSVMYCAHVCFSSVSIFMSQTVFGKGGYVDSFFVSFLQTCSTIFCLLRLYFTVLLL